MLSFFSKQLYETKDYKTTKRYCKDSDIPLLRCDFDGNEYVGRFKRDFITKWNKEITGLHGKKEFVEDIEALFDHNLTLAVQKTLLLRIVSAIDDLNESKCSITTAKMAAIAHRIISDDYLNSNAKVDIMRDLSILELSLVIAIKHHNDIYDGDPFNFEIILTRLHKFQNSGDFSTGPTDRAVVLKAFDVLKVCIVANLLVTSFSFFKKQFISIFYFSISVWWYPLGTVQKS